MKKIITLIAAAACALIFSIGSSAKVGFEVGYLNMSDFERPIGGTPVKSKPSNGFYFALNKDVKLFSILSVQPGLTYSFITDEVSQVTYGVKEAGKISEHWLNLPIYLKLNFGLGSSVGLFVYAGPTLSLGLSSTVKYSVSEQWLDGEHENASMSYNFYTGRVRSNNATGEATDWLKDSYGHYGLNRFDVMLGGGVGIDFAEIFTIKAGADYGLLNRLKNPADGEDAWNKFQFYVGIGLKF